LPGSRRLWQGAGSVDRVIIRDSAGRAALALFRAFRPPHGFIRL